MNKENANNENAKKLDTIIDLLQHMLIVQLYENGATQDVIVKHLHVAKTKVVEMVKGIKKKKIHDTK